MSWSDEICVSCGLCCTTLSIVRITDEDIGRLMRGYDLSRDQAYAMVRRNSNELHILMDKTASCPALSNRHGRYECNAYEHRPQICREYECYILNSAKRWLARQAAGEPPDPENAFESAKNEDELKQLVHGAIATMRSNALSSCIRHADDKTFRLPDFSPKLIHILREEEFENSFPPPPVRSAPEIRPVKR